MSLILATLLLAAPAAACGPSPEFEKVADLRSNAPVEKAGSGLWIAGTRFRGDDIVAAAADRDPVSGAWAVDVRLSNTGKNKFDSIQRCRVNNMVEISFDGMAISRPNLVEPIQGSVIRVAGSFTQAAAADLAARMMDFR